MVQAWPLAGSGLFLFVYKAKSPLLIYLTKTP